jgi:hypothetical protein
VYESIRFVAVAIGATALVLAVGCGQPPEEKGGADPTVVPPSAAPSNVPHNPSVVKSNELPANFPDDIPQYPEAKVLESRATSDMGLAVKMVVEDDADKVASFYADTLAAEGWTTDIRNMPDGNSVFADKGNRTAAVLVTENRSGSEVTLILGHH